MRIRGLDTALVALLSSVALVLSCGDDDPAKPKPPAPIVETAVIRDVDYIKHKYFLIDTPEDFAGALPSTLKIYVTVTQQELIDDPAIIRFPVWAIPDDTSYGEKIDIAIEALANGGTPPHNWHGGMRLLERGVDYELLTQPGDTLALGFALNTPIPPTAEKAVAVSYINGFGVPIGGQIIDNELILEIIKGPDPDPFGHFGSTFQMMMRNAYDLGFGTIDPANLTVKIEEVNTVDPTPETPDTLLGVPYAQIFGVDRTDDAGTGPPDGRVDHAFYGWLDDLGHSILWMPAYRAFAPPADLVQTWTDGGFVFSGTYLSQYETSQRIYDEALNATEEQQVHQYVIKATLTTPAQ
ncbi:MAG TPA: hypothetical protein VF247_02145 [Candidatus Krumholzibacteria bacterium]